MSPQEGTIRIKNYNRIIKASELSYHAEGALEIFHLGIWGGLSAENPSNIANVACQELGYTIGYQQNDAKITNTAPFKKFWINTIKCDGQETNLQQCQFGYGVNTTYVKDRYRVECYSKYQQIVISIIEFINIQFNIKYE